MLYHNVMWKFCDAEGKTLDENIERSYCVTGKNFPNQKSHLH